MAGDTEHKRGYRTIFRSISQVHSDTQSSSFANNNNNNNNGTSRRLSRSPIPDVAIISAPDACCECQDDGGKATDLQLRARSMQDLNDGAENRLRRQTVS
ncbi:hypothetical protein ACLKA6_015460 [Drosophila palustris]